MSGFWTSVGHWLSSIWSHHPVTWQSWAGLTYLVVVTAALFVVVFGRRPNTIMLAVAGLSALVAAIGAATLQNPFRFWGWTLIGVGLLFRPVRQWWLNHKKKVAAKAAKP